MAREENLFENLVLQNIKLLERRHIHIEVALNTFNSLDIILSKVPQCKQLFLESQGEELVESWLSHQNQDVRYKVSFFEDRHLKGSLTNDLSDPFF